MHLPGRLQRGGCKDVSLYIATNSSIRDIHLSPGSPTGMWAWAIFSAHVVSNQVYCGFPKKNFQPQFLVNSVLILNGEIHHACAKIDTEFFFSRFMKPAVAVGITG